MADACASMVCQFASRQGNALQAARARATIDCRRCLVFGKHAAEQAHLLLLRQELHPFEAALGIKGALRLLKFRIVQRVCCLLDGTCL